MNSAERGVEAFEDDLAPLTGSFALDDSAWQEIDGEFAQWLLESRERDGSSQDPDSGNKGDSSQAAMGSVEGVTPLNTGSSGSGSKKRQRSSDTGDGGQDTAAQKLERLRNRNRLAQARRRQRQRVRASRDAPARRDRVSQRCSGELPATCSWRATTGRNGILMTL
jgi:hypothetical protein